ncbi:MAG: FecR domain-containing protein [Proteobacteria bacterium]|nr:FecR domain-containing protein [Pseudomonadota bacterium]
MSRNDPHTESRRVEQAAAWALRLAERKLGPAQQRQFEDWLQDDPANGEVLEEVVGAWDAVEHYAAAEPMIAVREAALAYARRGSLRQGFWSRARHWAPRAVAACLAIGLLASAIWFINAPTSYTTHVGERRTVVLADGSTVSLDGDSEVRARFTDKERRLWLTRGRAQFSVAKNPLRPFSVEAADNLVVATGTAFSVELLKKQVRVVLYEGHVALLQGDRHGPQPILTTQGARAEQFLVPGREIILTPAVAVTPAEGGAPVAARSVAASVEIADPVRSLGWEEGQLAFEDEPLSIVAERMNRYSATPLEIADAATANTRISGVFRAGDTEALIEGLSAGFGVRAQSSSRAIVLSKRGG